MPENPRGWLLTAASRRLIDEFRSDAAPRQREEQDAFQTTHHDAPAHDDSLPLRLTTSHRVPAVRGHLLELAGDGAAAAEAYETATRLTTSRPERDYLRRKAAAVSRLTELLDARPLYMGEGRA